MSTRRTTVVAVVAAVLGLVAGALLWQVRDDPDFPDPTVDDRLALIDGRAVACPNGLDEPVDTDFRSLEGDVFLRAVLVDRAPDLSALYCLQVSDFDPIRPVPVRVTFTAPENGANYGETYASDEPGGSEELLNFPFFVGVYGGCREVSATVEQSGGATHSTRVRIGPRCDRG